MCSAAVAIEPLCNQGSTWLFSFLEIACSTKEVPSFIGFDTHLKPDISTQLNHVIKQRRRRGEDRQDLGLSSRFSKIECGSVSSGAPHCYGGRSLAWARAPRWWSCCKASEIFCFEDAVKFYSRFN